MRHRVKVTVLDTLLYEDLQHRYCQNPCSGKCPVYNKGDVFIFYREDGKDSFWQCGLNTLVSTEGDPKEITGGPDKPFCSEAWDAISRYIHGSSGRFDYERLDEGREHNDCVLFGWDETCDFQNRKSGFTRIEKELSLGFGLLDYI